MALCLSLNKIILSLKLTRALVPHFPLGFELELSFQRSGATARAKGRKFGWCRFLSRSKHKLVLGIDFHFARTRKPAGQVKVKSSYFGIFKNRMGLQSLDCMAHLAIVAQLHHGSSQVFSSSALQFNIKF